MQYTFGRRWRCVSCRRLFRALIGRAGNLSETDGRCAPARHRDPADRNCSCFCYAANDIDCRRRSRHQDLKELSNQKSSCAGTTTRPLRWVLLFLFPFLSHQVFSEYFSLKVESPVSGLLGSSVSLHCAVTNNMDVRPMEVRWYRPNMYDTPALFYRDTEIQKSPVDVQYQGRVFLLGDLEKGDVSVKLENLMLTDRGDYVCHVKSDIWFDKATVSLRLRVVGSTPVLSICEAGEGKVNVSCQSHGWVPEPSITWTDKDGRDLKHLSNDKFTNNSVGTADVSSWLIVSPSESEWISCSVGLSDQERKEDRIMLHVPARDTESLTGYIIIIIPVLLVLCVVGIAVCSLRQTHVCLILSRRKGTEKDLFTYKTAGTQSETEPLNKIRVENQDQTDAPSTGTVPHAVVVDLDQVKQYKVNISIDPEKTPESLIYEGKEVKRRPAYAYSGWGNPDNVKIFTLCKERFQAGKHYWEVKLRESQKIVKHSWFVGVASDEAKRKYNVPSTPQDGFWVLCYEKGDKGVYIRDQTEVISLPDVNKELTAVGVFLDCDTHTLSFYNINTHSHIYTFTNVDVRTSLRPLISPGVRDPHPVWII
ncbi:butyrophilin subfamily 2 member A1-like [Clarias gariepinus]|uniref:butyrophilin subfamily 2 member A1-like n=1 Tax=Clarias gariepinus TaxID=13013 RepID=UPI00234CD340|nr:butyrophilin subfamily 2 member A1-like [Clarias gariepinus]